MQRFLHSDRWTVMDRHAAGIGYEAAFGGPIVQLGSQRCVTAVGNRDHGCDRHLLKCSTAALQAQDA
jgi:hypothetical protein